MRRAADDENFHIGVEPDDGEKHTRTRLVADSKRNELIRPKALLMGVRPIASRCRSCRQMWVSVAKMLYNFACGSWYCWLW